MDRKAAANRPLGEGRDKNVVYYEQWGHKEGKMSFSRIWWMPNFHQGPMWRAQEFHANVDTYIASDVAEGRDWQFTNLMVAQ